VIVGIGRHLEVGAGWPFDSFGKGQFRSRNGAFVWGTQCTLRLTIAADRGGGGNSGKAVGGHRVVSE